ncbi:MAG: DUF1629 domain-containing protein [Syntrophobacteraceae bacterium]
MVYILKTGFDHFQWIHAVAEKDSRIFRTLFAGQSIADTWIVPEMEAIIENERDAKLPLGDCPHLASHIPVFSLKAMTALEPLVRQYGEFLKLAMKEQELYAFNVTKVVDALDMEMSDFKTFDDSSRIMYLKKIVLKEDVVQGLPIFKLIQMPLMDVYVNADFAEVVKKNGLKGFSFLPVSDYRFGV